MVVAVSAAAALSYLARAFPGEQELFCRNNEVWQTEKSLFQHQTKGQIPPSSLVDSLRTHLSNRSSFKKKFGEP